MVRTFEQTEAELRLEGMQPYPIFFELRDRLLTGEIGLDEAVMILNANYPSNPPSVEEWDDLHRVNPSLYYAFMESLDPKLRGLFDSDPEAYYKGLGLLETAENYVELMRLYNSREAADRFRALAGAVPEIDSECKEDLAVANKVMRENREALRKLAEGAMSRKSNPSLSEAKAAREREAARKLASMGRIAAGENAELARTSAENGSRRRWKRVEKKSDEQEVK